MSCLLVAEQNNELLMKNHGLRPTDSVPLPEANGTTLSEANIISKQGCGRGRGHGFGHGHEYFVHKARQSAVANESQIHQKRVRPVGSKDSAKAWELLLPLMWCPSWWNRLLCRPEGLPSAHLKDSDYEFFCH
ncbi:uncharacterized protein LOC111403718 [Olea europaea var. sylvestris]|uniref:uncharacterized protein LOC111403718 n=1 Tax=Olea europaea var. sylvestris TaxID=158386 RepID=UPI000C1D1E60|nr:uncharacterized protein LOC111403718 [Olea europaea var. sylvestris]